MLLQVEHIGKRYGKEVLHDVSFSLEEGQIVGLFGENGAGKTTLFKCILGLTGHQGRVWIDGEPRSRKNITKLSFATVEHSFFPGLTAAEHRSFYEMNFEGFRRERFETLSQYFGLPMNLAARHLSHGQKNQLETALALCQGARLILMDEPFAGNDIFNREDFYKALIALLTPEETILLATHLVEEVAGFADRTLLLRQGSLIEDISMAELEEEGRPLTELLREKYHYQGNRVRKLLDGQTCRPERKEL